MGEHTDYNEGLVLPFALAQGVSGTAAAGTTGCWYCAPGRSPARRYPSRSTRWRRAPSTAGRPTRRAWPGRCRAAGYVVRGASVERRLRPPGRRGRVVVRGAGVLRRPCALLAVRTHGAADRASGDRQAGRERVRRRAHRHHRPVRGAALPRAGAHPCCSTAGCSRRAGAVPAPSADGIGAGATALIIDTRVAHALVSGEYAARRAECEEAARLLRVRALGSVTGLRELDQLDDPVLRRRARHVVTDSARARAIAAALLEAGADAAEDRAPYRFIGESADRGARLAARRLRGLLASGRRRRRRRRRARAPTARR